MQRTEPEVKILKQHLKASTRKLKHGHRLVIRLNNDQNYTAKLVREGTKDNKTVFWRGHHKPLNKAAYKREAVRKVLSEKNGPKL